MAKFKMNESFTWAALAAADLSSSLNLFAKIDAAGKIAVAGNGDKVIGSIAEVATAGNPATVWMGPVVKVKAGAAVAAGARVQSDAAGKAVTLSAGVAAGVALEAAGAANVVIPVAMM